MKTGAGCSVLSATCRCRCLGLVLVLVLVLMLAIPRPAAAYSVLTHEANVDALWDDAIKPLLLQRFPRTTPAALLTAHAYAYGGSVIQDLGYYPFGSRFFSNLVHYVRSGDFVEALIRESREVNDYSFFPGTLAHYPAEHAGHPLGGRRADPLDDSMGMAGAHHPAIGLAGQGEIVGVFALAAHQRVVFLAAHRLPDPVFLQCDSVFQSRRRGMILH